MELLEHAVGTVNDILWSYLAIIFLIGIGVYFTVSTRFVQLRMLPEMLRLLASGFGEKTVNKSISSFQAFCVSTASRVGVGNIAGVAIAIVLGGPGAVFWMWCIAFIGCATGFVESTLAQIYKLPLADGKYHGGPAYYIQNALHMPMLAKWFALLISVTFGLIYVSVQANTIALSLEQSFQIPLAGSAVFLSILTTLVIFGGIHRIARVAEVMVPFFAGIYLLTALAIFVIHIDQVPAMFALILHDAFEPQAAVTGGFTAVLLNGIKRGLFSNEAGEGSVPNAAATADVSHPVKQGLLQSFGVFVDTWIICTATAVIILLSGAYTIGGELTGVQLTQQSLASIFGSFAGDILACMILLFAFSSIIGNCYYSEINITFLQGNVRRNLNICRILTVAMVIIGALTEMAFVWNMADLFMGLLCLTNLYAIARLYPYAKLALEDYSKQKAQHADPVFHPEKLGLYDGIFAWKADK